MHRFARSGRSVWKSMHSLFSFCSNCKSENVELTKAANNFKQSSRAFGINFDLFIIPILG